MFRLLCEFAVILEYDKMNCNLVSGVFYNVFQGVGSSYMNNHETNVLMNGRVKCIENLGKNSECMHVKCKLVVIVPWNNSIGIKFISTSMALLCDVHELSHSHL
jgi:hypothetical protein